MYYCDFMGMKDIPRTNLRLNKVKSVKWIYREGRHQQLLRGLWTPAPVRGSPYCGSNGSVGNTGCFRNGGLSLPRTSPKTATAQPFVHGLSLPQQRMGTPLQLGQPHSSHPSTPRPDPTSGTSPPFLQMDLGLIPPSHHTSAQASSR